MAAIDDRHFDTAFTAAATEIVAKVVKPLRDALLRIATLVARVEYCGEYYCPWHCGCDQKVYAKVEEILREVLGDEILYEWTKADPPKEIVQVEEHDPLRK